MSFQSFAQSSPASNGVSRRSHQYVVARENEHTYGNKLNTRMYTGQVVIKAQIQSIAIRVIHYEI